MSIRKQNENFYEMKPLWNAKISVYWENEQQIVTHFPIQNNKLIKFSHVKPLSMFEAKCDISSHNLWGILRLCNGERSIGEICEIIRKKYFEVNYEMIITKLEVLVEREFITLK